MAIVQDQSLIIAAQGGDRDAIQRLLVSCQFDIRRMARTECRRHMHGRAARQMIREYLQD